MNEFLKNISLNFDVDFRLFRDYDPLTMHPDDIDMTVIFFMHQIVYFWVKWGFYCIRVVLLDEFLHPKIFKG